MRSFDCPNFCAWPASASLDSSLVFSNGLILQTDCRAAAGYRLNGTGS